jgi:hypothetical protein
MNQESAHIDARKTVIGALCTMYRVVRYRTLGFCNHEVESPLGVNGKAQPYTKDKPSVGFNADSAEEKH